MASRLGDIVIEQKINEFFGDAESTGFGTGWWSGVLSVFFGFLALGGVVCLHFPRFLTSAEFRSFYSLHAIRLLIQFLIVAAVAFGVLSSLLRKKKTLAVTGMLLAIAATAWGGSSVKVNEGQIAGITIGMDWFLLDLLLMALIYVPLERIWPQYPEQGTFRKGWIQDVVYFMSTHLPIQILSFLVLLPAIQATKYLGVPVLQGLIARMPWLLQFFEGTRLDRGLTLTLCGRHAGARIYPCSSHAWIFAIDHSGVFDFCHASRHLDSLQF